MGQTRPLVGERLVDGKYEEYPPERSSDGSERSYSELPGVVFYWDGVQEFDVQDPAAGRTIDKRAAAEDQVARAEAELRLEREARIAEQAARIAAEARVRKLEERLYDTEDC